MKKTKVYHYQTQNFQSLFENEFSAIPFQEIKPQNSSTKKKSTETLSPTEGLNLFDTEVRAGKSEKAIFKWFASGFVPQKPTQYSDTNKTNLLQKINQSQPDYSPKSQNSLIPNFFSAQEESKKEVIIETFSHPFCKKYWLYQSDLTYSDGGLDAVFGAANQFENEMICISSTSTSPTQTFAARQPVPQSFLGKTICLPFFRYDLKGQKIENITDWALEQFKNHYETQWQIQKETNQFNLKRLFDFGDFENCQVEPALAVEIRQLTQWVENPKEINTLFQTVHQPNTQTEAIFKKITKTFDQIKKVFDRIGKKSCKNGESFEILSSYFREANEAIDSLREFFLQKGLEYLSIGEISLDVPINKEDVFAYVYAVLNQWMWHKKRLNQPIPLKDNFWQWVQWGRKLLDLHFNWENSQIMDLKEKHLTSNEKISSKFKILIDKNLAILELKMNEKLYQITHLPSEIWSYGLNEKSFVEIYLDYLLSIKNIENLSQISTDLKKVLGTCLYTIQIHIAMPPE